VTPASPTLADQRRSSPSVRATTLLRRRHQEIRALFRKVRRRAAPPERLRLREAIVDRLRVHATIEVENFVPRMSVLAELVDGHAHEEEIEIFTLATKLGGRDLESLGVRMAARAEEMLRALRQDPVRLLASPA
jgi:hypothetical protein